jgi:hypothetical protein
MTANRDLKRRVRDRQTHTGESYMSALHHVLAQRPGGEQSAIPSAIPTVEFVDATGIAAALGLKCRVSISPTLAYTIDVARTLERFRDTLTTAWRDPVLLIMRTIALDGEHVRVPLTSAAGFQAVQEARRFVERVLSGIGGASDNGRMLALHTVPRTMPAAAGSGSPPSQPAAPETPIAVFTPWLVPSFLIVPPAPLLIVTTLGPDPILERLRQQLR